MTKTTSSRSARHTMKEGCSQAMSGTPPTGLRNGNISVNVDANDPEAMRLAQQMFGNAAVVSGYTIYQRIGHWGANRLHKLGRHDFVWTYRAGIDAAVTPAVVVTKQLECSICHETKGELFVVEESV